MTFTNKLKSQAVIACLALFMGFTAATATPLDLATAPLIGQNELAPNIYLTLDDSGSMNWAYVPDSKGTYYRTREFASNSFNGMYYNPAVTYTPPLKADGTSYPEMSFTHALLNGFSTATSPSWTDLSTDYAPTQQGYSAGTGGTTSAYYDTYTGAGGCTPTTNTKACYAQTIITSSTSTYPAASTRSDCDQTTQTCTFAEESQNFANWYSYYRLRILAAKSAVSLAFGMLGTNVRVAGQNINDQSRGGANILDPSDPEKNSTLVQVLQPFTGTARTNWFTWLIGTEPGGGTPLRSRLNNVGLYYSTSGKYSPYAENPGVSDGTEYSCRRNYAVVMTDGLWNGIFSPGLGNVDDTDGPTITDSNGYSSQYVPQAPYEDSNTNSLADVAMYYWDHDLRPDLANNVPTYMPDLSWKTYTPPYSATAMYSPADFYNYHNDPADWQHMDTFTIGLVGSNTLGSTPPNPWPATSSNSVNNISDLWHAAIDGRGAYFDASSPADLVKAFTGVLDQIIGETASASSVAATSGRLETGTDLIAASFKSNTTSTGQDWTGDVAGYALDSTGAVQPTPAWKASCWLTGGGNCATIDPSATKQDWSSRQIITADWSTSSPSGQGIPFEWSSLSSAEQGYLNTNPDTAASDGLGSERLDYLRGDQSEEQNQGGTFRTRSSVLGDIVHSSPVYVGPPDDAYGDYYNSATFPEASSYAAFENAHANRTPVVYVGANDGMLHAFDADGSSTDAGKELLAFVPSVLMGKLNQLTAPDYTHQYYVDGTPTATDAYFNGAWHTVLVGGLGGGGKEIYCLDITDPSTFSESSASSIVMWEFTATKPAPYGDPDLGYTYSRPQVVRLADGKWAVVFGNGYNGADTSGSAHLYVVDLATGKLIRRLDTPAQTDPLVTNGTFTSNRPDGLATVDPVSTAGNMITDYVYAGDLYGNLWKFDLSSSDPSKWSVAYDAPLFTATDANGNPQPITTKPTVGLNTEGTGYMVYFGTGKYLENSDAVANTGTVQSVYGIWDQAGTKLTPISRSNLQQQQIIDQTTADGKNVEVVSQNSVDWTTQDGWYLDLEYKSPQGQMVIADPKLENGALLFNTFTPNSDPCSSGGTTWDMALDAQTGGRLSFSAFDVNGDGKFDHSDYVTLTVDGQPELVPVSGFQSNGGIAAPTGVYNNGTELSYDHNTDGGITQSVVNLGPGTSGRQSWRQLR